MLNNEIVATTNAGLCHNCLDLALNEPGVYWISIRSADGSITGKATPPLVEENPEFRIYWGDTQGHSGYSEGIGTVDYFMRFARDDARLDYVTHSEHDVWLDAGEWDLIRRTSAEYDEPGKNFFLIWVGNGLGIPASVVTTTCCFEPSKIRYQYLQWNSLYFLHYMQSYTSVMTPIILSLFPTRTTQVIFDNQIRS
ncbi:MAG: hypothetical protein Ct9H300mP22_5010 [Gammaproteobacteria bacterium]|nr:MAG: hypothetical protein Ct9H300mP22_5010 [Gammaproteobacteria bacterium]